MGSYNCGLQGPEDRLYCMTKIEEGMEGAEVPYTLNLAECPEPIYELPAVQIPVPKATCTADLDEKSCLAVGGDFEINRDKTTTCNCP
jgi:hypothetical protein